MKKKICSSLYVSLSMLVAFVFWTIAINFIDVREIGPENSSVGFATVNGYFHNLTGVHMWIYNITDWLGLVPIFVTMGFGLLGLIQWVKRKQLSKVDYSIFILGGFYVVVMAVYVLFEMVTINYRPVLINGFLETSYPSSTTLLVMCVMPTAIMQFNSRIKNETLKECVSLLITLFIIFMVVGRLVSGVHWLTDIVGGALLGAGLVMMYRFFVSLKNDTERDY